MPVSISGDGAITGIAFDTLVPGTPVEGDVIKFTSNSWSPQPGYSGPSFYAEPDDLIDIDFSEDSIRSRVTDGTVVFSGLNYAQGKSATVRITSLTQALTLSFPAGWIFLSIKPTTLDAAKTGVLTVTSFGSSENDVVAAWGNQL